MPHRHVLIQLPVVRFCSMMDKDECSNTTKGNQQHRGQNDWNPDCFWENRGKKEKLIQT